MLVHTVWDEWALGWVVWWSWEIEVSVVIRFTGGGELEGVLYWCGERELEVWVVLEFFREGGGGG